jgi:hypothetical protein
MNDLALLLSSFDVKILFDIAKSIADAVGLYLSPVLLLMAIYIRLMETQVDALASGGKYGTALRDMMIWTFVLGSYYSIGAYVIEFVNPIYTWLDSFGSLGKTMEAFSTIMAKSNLSIQSGGVTLIGLASAPYVVIAELFYYGTLILVAFLTAFLKIANVMTFGIAFIWGLIAIPISISTTFRILRGWAYLLGFALVWPIVQGLLMAMFSMLFAGSSETLMTLPDADPMLRSANIMMLFAVMHLLLGAVMVAAPFIANALVTNASAASGVVMPFVGAAVGAAAGTAAAGHAAAKNGYGSLQRLTGNSTVSKSGPTPRMSGSSMPSASTPTPASTSNLSTSGSDAGGSGVSGTPPAPATDAGQQQKRQQRRGTIIRQQLKSRGKA